MAKAERDFFGCSAALLETYPGKGFRPDLCGSCLWRSGKRLEPLPYLQGLRMSPSRSGWQSTS